MGSAKATPARKATAESTEATETSTVVVRHAIIHNLNPLEENEPFLSESELEIEPKSKLKKYLEDHIANVLTDEERFQAIFSSTDDKAEAHCRSILESPRSRTKFVSSSQQLAWGLFAAMGTDARVKPGSLAVCLYYEAKSGETPYLALLKLDLGQVILQKPGKDAEGHRMVSFEVHENGLPTTREKLHKAAIVKPDYNLILLDRQVSAMAAGFFAQKFLSARPASDAVTQTELLDLALKTAYTKLTGPPTPGRPSLNAREADQFLQQRDAAFGGNKVGIDQFVSSLPGEDAARELVLNEIQKQLPATGVARIDRVYAQKVLKTKRYRGAFGFLLEFDAGSSKDLGFGLTELSDGKTRVVLEVPDFRRIR